MKKTVLFLGIIICASALFPGCTVRRDFCECVNLEKALTDQFSLSEKEKRKKEEECKWIKEELSPMEILQKTAECWDSELKSSQGEKELEGTRIADSIRVADSMARVQEEQKKVADSIEL